MLQVKEKYITVPYRTKTKKRINEGKITFELSACYVIIKM